MKIIKIIQYDLKSFYHYPNINSLDKHVSFLYFIKAILDIDFRAILLYRISSSLISNGMKRTGLLIYYRLKSAHSIDISPFANIGSGLKIVHAFNIVIGPGVDVGKNCVIFNSVTLGNSHPGWKREIDIEKLMPIIGERVTLCPGVRVIGKVSVGNDAFIGANSVVVKNIPSSETWAGIPAKKISSSN
jgi:serine O-acetyltransferase